MTSESGGPRRWIALGALAVGLGLAWWTGRDGLVDVQASLLLTHLPLPRGDGDGRGYLVRLEVEIPAEPGSTVIGWRHTLIWPRGEAPEATPALRLRVPEGTRRVGVRCTFALDGSGTRHRTQGQAALDPLRKELQVIDVGNCR